jgi:outer membrane protein assembly factor BamB
MTLKHSALLFGFLAVTTSLSADTWPGWRGALGTGVSSETDLPVQWSTSEGLLWTADLPGRGNSSPVVTRDRVYVTGQDEKNGNWVTALERSTGRPLWKKLVTSKELEAVGEKSLYAHRHNAATPTPVADENHVWVFFGTGALFCLDKLGTVKWEVDLAEKFGKFDVRFGMASSPRLWGDFVLMAIVHKGPSYVVALEKATGHEVWKTERKFPAKWDGPDGYSSPVLLESEKTVELVVSGCDHVDAYDPRSGRRLWYSSGLTVDSHYGRVIASPAVGEGYVVACSANPPNAPGHAIVLKAGGQGDVTAKKLWSYTPYSPDAPTPVCYRGRVYMVRDDGVGSILELASGKKLWRDRVGEGPFRAATVAGDGKVYFLSRDGVCTVIQAGTEGKVLARNTLEGQFYSTPAISDGRIYLRAFRKLYAVGPAKP